MSRIRSLKPSFFTSASLVRCSIPARVTFAGLWTQADDDGRGVADAVLLYGSLWIRDPNITAVDVEKHLLELAETDHIRLYEVGDKRYFEVVNWAEHQSAKYRRGNGVHPAPPSETLHRDGCKEVQPAPAGVLEREKETEREKDARPAAAGDSFEADFTECWDRYPRKLARKDALKAYQARRREGISPEALLRAVVNFADAMLREGRTPEKIMHGATFFGPNERWKDYEKPVVVASGPGRPQPTPPPECPDCGELVFDCRCPS